MEIILKDEIEEEEKQLEIEFECENLDNIILSDLIPYNSNNFSEQEKIDYLKILPRKELKSLIISMEFVDQIISALFSVKYISPKIRKYFCTFMKVILGENHQDYQPLLEMFQKNPSELPYIRTRYRNRIWQHFEPWKDVLLSISYVKKNKWLYLNGEPTLECRDIFRKLGYIYSYGKAADSYKLEVTGSVTEDKFRDDMKEYPEIENIIYIKTIFSDDSESRSGDKVEGYLVDIPLLPYKLSAVHDGGVGRGTIGAHLLLNSQ